jgi:DNA ligase (NAD+)
MSMIDANEYNQYKNILLQQYRTPNIRTLEDELRNNASAYYNGDIDNIIPDWQYDLKLERLRDLYPQSRFLFEVGSRPTTDVKVKHPVKMLSLDKIKLGDVYNWMAHKPNDLVGEVKLDGVSLSVEYNNGDLYKMSTRGDGEFGDDLTRHAANLIGIPKHIPVIRRYASVLVRGEGVISKQVFKEKYSEEYSNTRNLVAGLMRRLEPVEADTVSFLAYGLIGDIPFNYYWDIRYFLSELGFNTVQGERMSGLEGVKKFYSDWVNKREEYEYDIDGVVIKIDSMAEQRRIGVGSSAPKHSFCLKFEAKGGKTVLEDLIWQVGRTGLITPVAIVSPISIDNVTITRIMMDNPSEVEKFRLHKGDTVYVVRANDVIPDIMGNETLHPEPGIGFDIPGECPVCGKATVRVGPRLFCKNAECEAQAFMYLKHYIRVHKILGIGDEILKGLIDTGGIANPSDFYDLTPSKIEFLNIGTGILGWKRAEAICNEILSTKTQELSRFIWSLGIPLIGEGKSEDLARHVKDFDGFMSMIQEGNLGVLEGFSVETMKALIGVRDTIVTRANTLKAKISVVPDGSGMSNTSLPNNKEINKYPGFGGMSFAITGTLSMKRDEFIQLIKDNGGVFNKNPTKGTTAIIVGEVPGNNKIVLAAKNNVPELSEIEFITALGQPNMINVMIQGKSE